MENTFVCVGKRWPQSVELDISGASSGCGPEPCSQQDQGDRDEQQVQAGQEQERRDEAQPVEQNAGQIADDHHADGAHQGEKADGRAAQARRRRRQGRLGGDGLRHLSHADAEEDHQDQRPPHVMHQQGGGEGEGGDDQRAQQHAHPADPVGDEAQEQRRSGRGQGPHH